MDLSTVIRTYKREHLLARAVASVRDQGTDCGEREIIVVNDSGLPLAPADWQQDDRVRVYTTYETRLCVAGNTGVALARGDHLHFLDDDDVLLPGAYAALLKTATASGAVLTYGAYETMDDDGTHIETICPWSRGDVFALVVADARIPLGAGLIRREAFLAAGGLDSSVIPAEDADLLQRLALLGRIEFTEHHVARFRVGTQGATTAPWHRAREAGRLTREKRFADPRCLPRLLESLSKANDRGALRGRLVRLYSASAARHARSSPLTALSRALVALRFAAMGVPNGCFFEGLRGGW